MKIKIFVLTLFLLIFITASAVIGQDSTGELEEIQEFKDKLASKVAELQQNEDKAIAGFASDINESSLKIITSNNEKYSVELDDLLTKYFSIGNSITEKSKEDISEDDYLIVTGPVNGDIISANGIYIDTQYVSGSGIVSQTDQNNLALTIITLENDTFTIDIETSTKRQIINIKELKLDNVGFSTIKAGDVVHFIYKEFNEEIASKTKKLDDLLPKTFALVREASRRVLGQRHFDVQLLAGIGLHEGKIAEQKTGEGKTLSATTAMYHNALEGKGVHLVTVNDYLARRDAGWMGGVFHFLGLKTSAMVSDKSYLYDKRFEDKGVSDWRLKNLKPITRKEAYEADITYGINSEFGFDYLRDNMAVSPANLTQRGFNFAIIDEADSVLIDEARTPHIISAPYAEDPSRYYEYARIIKQLDPKKDFVIDEKARSANLTDEGISRIEKILGTSNIYEKDFDTLFHIEASLKAEALFKNNKEYIVKDGQVVIVDEFTGRLLEGRRFSEGIHQAIEAKENVSIQ